jgi:PKD repeat protein
MKIMKIDRTLKILGAVLGLTLLMCSVSKASLTIRSNSWTNAFPVGTNTTYFTGGAMAGTAWWWGDWPQCNNAMTNDPAVNEEGNSSDGSLYLSIPFTGSGQQGWFMSTFDDAYGWGDGAVQIPLNIIKNLAFDIYMKSGTAKDGNGNYGRIQMNLIMGTSTGGFATNPVAAEFEELVIPGSADGAWVHLEDTNVATDVAAAITAGFSNAAGVFFYYDNNAFGGYPPSGQTMTFWMDNFAVTTGTSSSPPVAQFKMSSNIGVAPFTVTFTDTSLNSPTSWAWTFGDGGTSTSQNPSHTFTNIWRQTVTLKASNAYGSSSATQAVYQCFPCDAVYDWTNGVQGHVANVTTLSNSLVGGSSKIGYFTTTNHDLPSTNLQGMIYTNLPGMTNGCPVVFSNGVIYSNFNTTNAIAYTFTNDHEQFTFHFNSGYTVTDVVFLFYDSMPFSTNTFSAAIDEVNIASTGDSTDLGGYCLNRDLGESGPLSGFQNDYHTSETIHPTVYGSYNGISDIYGLANKLYRILFEENTNGKCVLAVGDPVTSSLVGFVTNFNSNEAGDLMTAIDVGHTSGEVFVTNTTCIQTYHDILRINRPLTWTQVSNVVMFGP